MYRIAIVRKGQQTERSIGDAQGIEDAVYAILRTETATSAETDAVAIRGLITEATSLCEAQGFAAIKFGNSAVTIRTAQPEELNA